MTGTIRVGAMVSATATEVVCLNAALAAYGIKLVTPAANVYPEGTYSVVDTNRKPFDPMNPYAIFDEA